MGRKHCKRQRLISYSMTLSKSYASLRWYSFSFLYKYDPRDGSLARRGIACWSCQLLLDVSNRKASRRAEKKLYATGRSPKDQL
ncbi:hypothetical protein Prudu_82S000100 [Prunus dulcis]|uniref:Uncharacterized protein n=1 Tax=Prunus dulcis TaxID=3755 RepID=A0A5H2XLZ0_PRUDU|nr:hypothetical protein Prudu_82S000100 [Prunus dulcis]